MTVSERNELITLAMAGKLTPYQQAQLANELQVSISMALRLERALHALVKEAEADGRSTRTF